MKMPSEPCKTAGDVLEYVEIYNVLCFLYQFHQLLSQNFCRKYLLNERDLKVTRDHRSQS